MSKEYFPTKMWRKLSAESKGISRESIDYLNTSIIKDYPHIRSVLIIREGAIIYEKYMKGCNEKSVHEVACIFKSFLSAVIGRAITQGIIDNVDERLVDIFKDELPTEMDKRFNQITLRHLLTKSSGLKWPSPSHKFLEEEKVNDIKLPLSLELVNKPGDIFKYKPDPHILYYVIEKLTYEDFLSYADKNLLEILGIKEYSWNTDYFDNACMSLKTRDIAKLGYLYLREGVWESKKLIELDYINESTRKQLCGGIPECNDYGYLWWIHKYSNYKCYYAGGFGGQYLCIVPELDIIFVITSELDGPHQDNKLLIKRFIDMNTFELVNDKVG